MTKLTTIPTCIYVPRKHNCDEAQPAAPTLVASHCFTVLPKGAVKVQSTPNPRPIAGKDPVRLVLSGIEPNAKILAVNISSNPEAGFDEKGQAMQLPCTGYNPRDRTWEMVLDQSEMTKRGMSPGDFLEIIQVDTNGNRSADSLVIYLEPNAWAHDNYRTSKGIVTGGEFDVMDGLVGVQGSAAGKMLHVRGAVVSDTKGPKVFDHNISFRSVSWSPKELDAAKVLQDSGALPIDREVLEEMAKDDAGPLSSAAKCLLRNDAAFLTKFADAVGASLDGFYVDETDVSLVLDSPQHGNTTVYAVFNNATEPGTRLTVSNSSRGTQHQIVLGMQERYTAIPLPGAKNGDCLLVDVVDRKGNAAPTLSFAYDEHRREGKGSTSVLATQARNMQKLPKRALVG